MNASRAVIAVVICVVQSLALNSVAQTSPPLLNRIPKADPKKYQNVRDGQEWQNPKMFVRPDGIEVVGVTATGQGVPAESVPEILQRLPNSAWPYGLVVMGSDIGLLRSIQDKPMIQTNRTKLLKILKQHGIVVELWPSA
jgi:hypothetical protein